MHVASEAIQLGDNENGAAMTTFFKSCGQRRAVGVLLATLDLLELGEKKGSGVQKVWHGLPLRFKAQSILTWALGQDAAIGDQSAHGREL